MTGRVSVQPGFSLRLVTMSARREGASGARRDQDGTVLD